MSQNTQYSPVALRWRGILWAFRNRSSHLARTPHFLISARGPIRILGGQFNFWVCFSEQVGSLLNKANVRRGIMARLITGTWGSETGLLRSTHSAVLIRTTDYGLEVCCWGANEGTLYGGRGRFAQILKQQKLGG